MTRKLDTPTGWVWLIGGASGTGKTRVAYPLAQATGAAIVEVDDIVEGLLAMTTPAQQPALHYWPTHPEAASLPPEGILKLHLAVARALVPALEAIVANHLDSLTPVIIEGDYLLPAFAAQTRFGGQAAEHRVRAVFLAEPDLRRLVRNFGDREPGEPPQTGRAQVSRLFGAWLTREANRVGVPVVSARPWKTVIERVADSLNG
jgi:2-phosphoglycerate kinase